MSDERIQSFSEFWPFYVREHSQPACRAFHFVGSTLSLAVLVAAIAVSPWWLLAAPLVGYGFAWFSHFTIEKNRPASFKYPLWSFIADWKMWALMLVGRMGGEVQKAMAAAR
ncbi:MAG TPA: DUF962 domain-containing protein [Pirellulales bacterium]|jgi:hypothetical protein|nr:DUF962 domain-containing protein [Pirellulales bacterium]